MLRQTIQSKTALTLLLLGAGGAVAGFTCPRAQSPKASRPPKSPSEIRHRLRALLDIDDDAGLTLEYWRLLEEHGVVAPSTFGGQVVVGKGLHLLLKESLNSDAWCFIDRSGNILRSPKGHYVKEIGPDHLTELAPSDVDKTTILLVGCGERAAVLWVEDQSILRLGPDS